jgi:hypothetical protein
MKFHVVKEFDATPEQVWSVIGDFAGTSIKGLNQTIVEKGDKNGVGTVRKMTLGNSTFTERIDAVEPGKSVEYSIIAGTPLKWYKGKGIIMSSKRPATVEWHGEFESKFPIPNFMAKMVSRKNVLRYLCEVEKALKAVQ